MVGLEAERKVARDLTAKGYLVASRRHFGGAGDILAVTGDWAPADVHKDAGLLIEVKATTRGPFAGFPPEDREAMRFVGWHFDLTPLLAWVQGSKLFYIPAEDWPA